MIDNKSITQEWIVSVSKSKKADKVLVQKTIWALKLLEGLVLHEMSFIFKGGTSLMLLLGRARRLSIDIDIITETEREHLENLFDSVAKKTGFTHWESDEREKGNDISKAHYKFFFEDALGQGFPQFILLDVLFEKHKYEELQASHIVCDFVSCGEPITVQTPTLKCILGDKLTAFAPNTTGIPFFRGNKSMGMEIMKQLYDIGCIFEGIDTLDTTISTFTAVAKDEMKYRRLGEDPTIILEDIIDTARVITARGKIDPEKYNVLEKGRDAVKSFIFSETFHLDRAITFVARTAYMANRILAQDSTMEKYDARINMKDWAIEGAAEQIALNKLKKSNPEAFFYWYRIYMR